MPDLSSDNPWKMTLYALLPLEFSQLNDLNVSGNILIQKIISISVQSVRNFLQKC